MRLFNSVKRKFDYLQRILPTSIFSASLSSLIASIFSQGTSFLSLLLLAKLMSSELFGKFSIVYSTMLFLSVVTILGGTVPLTKRIADSIALGEKRVISSIVNIHSYLSIVLLLLISITSLIFPDNVSLLFFGTSNLSSELFYCIVTLIFYTLYTIQTSIFYGFREQKIILFSSVIRSLLNLSPVLGYILLGFQGSILSLCISYFVSFVINIFLLKNIYKKENIDPITTFTILSKSQYLKELKSMLPYFLGSLFVFPVTWITNRLLISLPRGYQHLGAFNTVYQLRNIVVFIPNSLGNIILPTIANLYSNQETKRLIRVVKFFLFISLASALVLNLLILIGSPFIVDVFQDPSILSDKLIFIMSIANFLLAIQIPLGIFLNAIGKMWTGFFLNFGWAVILIFSFIILSRSQINNGSLALAMAYVIAYICLGFGLTFFTLKNLR